MVVVTVAVDVETIVTTRIPLPSSVLARFMVCCLVVEMFMTLLKSLAEEDEAYLKCIKVIHEGAVCGPLGPGGGGLTVRNFLCQTLKVSKVSVVAMGS
jgi:hypothetical protein